MHASMYVRERVRESINTCACVCLKEKGKKSFTFKFQEVVGVAKNEPMCPASAGLLQHFQCMASIF